MPRGAKPVLKEKTQPTRVNPRRAATSFTTRAPSATSTITTRGRKKNKMEVTSSRKRKNESEEEKGTGENNAPVSKKQRKGKVVAIDETDRAVHPDNYKKVNGIVPDSSDADTLAPEAESIIVSHHSHGKVAGQVMVLGQGDTGQLGLGSDVMERKKPSPVSGVLEGLQVVQVVCGGMHTAALSDDGKVFTWGCNDEGALGRVLEEDGEYTPGHVTGLNGIIVVQISAGDSHTAALAQNGDVYCWGVFRDSNGPFGLIQSGTPSPSPKKIYPSLFSPSNSPALKIASGSDHIVILTSSNDIITLGCAEQGQLGRVPEVFSSRGGRKGTRLLLEPHVVRFRKPRKGPKPKFMDVFCGSYHTFALTEDEAVYSWGLNNYGQLGTDDTESYFQPKRLPEDWIKEDDETDSIKENKKKENAAKTRKYDGLEISGGQHHTVVCNKGSVYVLGRKEYGRLGLGENISEEPCTPRRIPTLSKISHVSTGTICSFAVSDPGDIFSWGMGTNQQLGTGEEEDEWKPVKVTGKKIGNKKVIAASGGGQHTAILVSLPHGK